MSEWAALLVTVDPWDMAPEGSWPGVVFKESFGVLTVGEFLVTDGAPPPVGVSREGFRRGHKQLTETLEQVLSGLLGASLRTSPRDRAAAGPLLPPGLSCSCHHPCQRMMPHPPVCFLT